ncbi:MAG: hypothetical protein ACKVOK_12605 [Flavobacteriales bacterium]
MKNTLINNIFSFGILLIALNLISCSEEPSGLSHSQAEGVRWPDSELSAAEYQNWVKNVDNGFTSKKSFDEIEIAAVYVPAELKAIRELGPEAADKTKLNAAINNYTELEFYELTITMPRFNDEALKYNLSSQEEYQHRIEYYSFHANADALLVLEGDTVKCPVHSWERTYNGTNKIVLSLAFPAEELKNKRQVTRELIYTDAIYGLGPLHFRF